MKIVIATDSFKGCLSSLDAGTAIKNGLLKSYPDADIKVFPISDGGEGLTDALKEYLDTETIGVEVTGPEFKKLRARYGLNRDRKLAVIEMASAAGLPLVNGKKDVKYATTYGVGEMIIDAIEKGAREFIIGIGGSATNDGGIGMLSALGFRFLDRNGNKVIPNALGLKNIDSIDLVGAIPELKECTFTIACDVDILLCGDNGCSKIFAPQKGASQEDINQMDMWLNTYADITRKYFPLSDKDVPGSGAAGGMGFAFRSYLNATLKPGIDIVISSTGLESAIKEADYVITGEGKIDNQTSKGKVISGVLNTAKKYSKPVIAFCGSASDDCDHLGLERIVEITPKDMSLDVAMKPDVAMENIEAAVKNIGIFRKFFMNSNGGTNE